MHLRILGTGNAWNGDGRGSPGLVVTVADAACLVDVGPTVMQACARFGVDCASVDRLFLTHLHGDHTAGWPFFLLHQVSVLDRTRPFEVYGPPGTRSHLERLAGLCYGKVLAKREFELQYRELPVATAHGLVCGSWTFDVLPMRHHETSIAYRFVSGGLGLGVSGDTAWCDNLEALARASDLLVLECSSVEPSPWRHLSLAELRDRFDRLGHGKLLLVHSTDEVARALAADPLPRVLAPHDGDVFSLGNG